MAPVVIHSSTHRLSSNGGRNNVVYNEQCDFAIEYTGASIVGGKPGDEIPFSCFSFDVDTCFGEEEGSVGNSFEDSSDAYRSAVTSLLLAATIFSLFL